jgi:hypothetical protein
LLPCCCRRLKMAPPNMAPPNRQHQPDLFPATDPVGLGRRYARVHLDKYAGSPSEHDVPGPQPGSSSRIDTQSSAAVVLEALRKIPDSDWSCKGRENVRMVHNL